MDLRVSCAALVALLAMTSGCLIIPTDYYTSYSRENVGEATPAAVSPGCSRENLLLSLGEPDAFSRDETEFWYVASKVKAIIIVGDKGGEHMVDYVQVVRFDKNGRVNSSATWQDNANGVTIFLEGDGIMFPP